MAENRNRFVLVTQQAFACVVVLAFAVSALGVIELEIVPPAHGPVTGAMPADRTALVSSGPVEPTVRTVPLQGVDRRGLRALPGRVGTGRLASERMNVLSAPLKVEGYATVGVTWKHGAARLDHDAISVRTKVDGVWSEWEEMHYDDDHQADPAESASQRDGTDAVVVGDVDQVQVRAVAEDGAMPKDLALAIIDPGEDLAAVEEETGAGASLSAASTPVTRASMPVAPKPTILTRAQWGADERMRDKSSLRYGEIHAGFVHHTVNANSYTREQVPAILRGIYAYHTQSRGWSDVGYNFLVDRFGRIWEGRAGGIDRPVVGAHTLGYNDDSFAMSAIGNFEEVQPTEAMVDAYAALMAWKLSLHGVDAASTKQWVTSRNFAAINGHRDAGSTACPGRYLYARIPDIRAEAKALQGRPAPEFPTTTLNADLSGGPWPDLVVRDRRTDHALIIRTGGQVTYLAGLTAATGWKDMDLVAAAGDLDGDGLADIVARSASTGAAAVYRGTPGGKVGAGENVTNALAGLDQLTGVGDFDGDGTKDLVGRDRSTQRLLLFPGRGDGTFRATKVLASDWSAYDLTAGVDDFDGDGRRDLVARSGERLYLVPGTADGIGGRTALAGDWGGFDLIAGRGDANGDKRPDLVARRDVSGRTFIYPGDGAGQLTPRIGGWPKYRHLRWISLAGQLAGSKKPDLAGLAARAAELKVFENTGRKNLGATFDTGVDLGDVDLLVNVGDWNGDGRGDVMTRQAGTGVLHFRAGKKKNQLADPVVARTGFAGFSLVTPVGDITGDGYPDLVARGPKGKLRVHPSNGRTGFGSTYALSSGVEGVDGIGLGRWDGDGTPDTAVRREDGTLWLLSPDGAAVTQLAAGLEAYDWVRGLGDLDRDGRADLVVRDRSTGHLYLLRGKAKGFAPRRLIGIGFEAYDLVG